MRKFFLALCGFWIVVTFTGCIEIFEELNLNNKGGGHFSQKVDMSGAMSMINSMKNMSEATGEDSTNENQPAGQEDPGKALLDSWNRLTSIEGISNVRIVSDTSNYVYIVDYDFSDESALNNAIEAEQKSGSEASKTYTITRSSISRSEVNMAEGMMGNEEDESSAEMMKSMLSDMKYHVTITVPGKIKSVSNKVAEISSDKKTVTIQSTLGEMADKKKSLKLKIDYK